MLDYVSAIIQGDFETAKELSIECISCGMCAARCPGELAPMNMALMVRRLMGRAAHKNTPEFQQRLTDIRNDKFKAEITKYKGHDQGRPPGRLQGIPIHKRSFGVAMRTLTTPISKEDVASLKVGDQVVLVGRILCGRDAVLPKIVKMFENNDPELKKLHLEGAVIFIRRSAVPASAPPPATRWRSKTASPSFPKRAWPCIWARAR